MREIDVTQLEQELAAGGELIDVREAMEYVDAHVPGARLIPMGQLPSRVGELDRSRPVLLICRSGNRSGAMAQLLDAQGFETVNVVGGTQAWIDSGRRVETGTTVGAWTP